MKKILPALAVALIAGFAASSSAQAAVHVIDFSAGVLSSGGGSLSVTPMGASVETSVAFDFDSTVLDVTAVGPDDTTGQFLGNVVTLKPTDIMYGSGSGPSTLPGTGVVKTWTIGSDKYTEILTDVSSIARSKNSIAVTLTGMVSDSMGVFVDTPASMLLSATQVGGAGRSISVSLTNFAATSAIPEPSTWVMMALGFVGLGYAATRRGKANSAVLSV
jgi:hypothetical protein